MDWDFVVRVGEAALVALGAAAAALRIVAPKTATDKDDKAATAVGKAATWLTRALGFVVVPKSLKR